MEASAEPLDPVLATIIAVTLVVLIFVIPIASVLASVFSKSSVIVLATCLLSAAGFLVAIYPHPVVVPAGIAIQLSGLLLAIGGVQSRRKWAAVWHALEELSASVYAPSIVPHEEPSTHFMPAPKREDCPRGWKAAGRHESGQPWGG
jgi:H+/gluconate symporter-like permease